MTRRPIQTPATATTWNAYWRRMQAYSPTPTRDVPENLNLEQGAALSSLGSITMAGCLLVAATVGAGVAAQSPNAGLLVPLHVVEPAQWFVHGPGTERQEKQSLRVSFGDLDLSKAAGVSELYERLQRASERVCGGNARAQSSSEKHLCISGALAKAVAEVNLRGLHKLHSG